MSALSNAKVSHNGTQKKVPKVVVWTFLKGFLPRVKYDGSQREFVKRLFLRQKERGVTTDVKTRWNTSQIPNRIRGRTATTTKKTTMTANDDTSSFSSSSSRFLKNTCLILIGTSRRFLRKRRVRVQNGYDVALTRKTNPALKSSESARNANILVVHTREGHRQTLRDLPKTNDIGADWPGPGGRKGPLGKIL